MIRLSHLPMLKNNYQEINVIRSSKAFALVLEAINLLLTNGDAMVAWTLSLSGIYIFKCSFIMKT